MRIAVLGSARSWHVGDLHRAAGDRHELVALPFTRLQAAINADQQQLGSGDILLDEFDALLVRSMPSGSLEQVVFRMNVLAAVEQSGVLIVNTPRSLEVAIDKYLALMRLQKAGFCVPDTITCQHPADAFAAAQRLGDEVVMKPLFGGEGRGVVRVAADELLAGRSATGDVYYLQRFIPHGGRDLRLLAVGDRVLGMQRVQSDDWRTNVSLGARCQPLEVSCELAELARRAAQAVGATICALDLLPGNDGQLYALEVNAVPGWRALAQTTGTDVAKLVLDHLEALNRRQR